MVEKIYYLIGSCDENASGNSAGDLVVIVHLKIKSNSRKLKHWEHGTSNEMQNCYPKIYIFLQMEEKNSFLLSKLFKTITKILKFGFKYKNLSSKKFQGFNFQFSTVPSLLHWACNRGSA
jgi:hypothetical protein